MGAARRQRRRRCSHDPASAILDIDRAVTDTLRSPRASRPSTSASRSPAACCPGSTRTSATARAARSGRARPRPTRSSAATANADPGRRHLRARRRHALPQPGADHQAAPRRAAGRDRGACSPTANDWVKVVPNQREESLARAHAGRGDRHARRAGRPAAQAADGRRVPVGVHGRRPAAVGRRRAAAPDAPNPSGVRADGVKKREKFSTCSSKTMMLR